MPHGNDRPSPVATIPIIRPNGMCKVMATMPDIQLDHFVQWHGALLFWVVIGSIKVGGGHALEQRYPTQMVRSKSAADMLLSNATQRR